MTLENIHQYTRLEVFQYVKNHLLKQNRKSMGPLPPEGNCQFYIFGIEVCLYRGPGGAQCAVGCLISDSMYSPTMENIAVNALMEFEDVKQLKLLERLQNIHDNFAVEDWREELDALEELITKEKSVKYVQEN